MSTTAVVVIILVLLAAAAAGVVLARRRRSTQLQQHFGPEYEREVSAASGDRKAAEAALAERQQRRQEFDVRDLRPEERTRFRESWNDVQRDFVDDPRRSLNAADALVGDVMRTRGYPVDDDFDRRADDLSVDHPRVVEHYRAARHVRDADDSDTEAQRTAITSYRSLVDALLGDDDGPDTPRDDARRADDRPGDGPRADERADGTAVAADRSATDGRVADRSVTDGAHASADPDAPRRDPDPADAGAGRHALRDPRDDGPTDPNGPQGPRSEERTR